MKLHIGKEIEARYKDSGIKLSEFAKRLNTTPRNVYTIFERNDIKTDLLQRISDVLHFNFFTLYQSTASALHEPQSIYDAGSQTGQITIMVTLDGQESTLNQWIKRLTLINKSML
jgi:hypothetical protein